MPEAVIACYRPKPGKEADLLALIREHLPVLRAEGLATERESWVLRAADGAYIEIFEWNSAAAVDAAHGNPAVQALWNRFAEICEFAPVGSVKETGELFSAFEPVEL